MRRLIEMLNKKWKNIYIEKINTITNELDDYYNEYKKINEKHIELNTSLGKFLDEVEKQEFITKEQANIYLSMRSENDAVNSRLKLLSVKGNNLWIKYQRLKQLFYNTFIGDFKIKNECINRENGRLFMSTIFLSEKINEKLNK